MLKILFVTGASHKSYMVNFNHYQRVHFLSRQADLTIYARRGASFSVSASQGTEVVNAPFSGKLGMVISCILWLTVRGRSKSFDVVLTEPSKLCICGLFGKIVLGAKWVVDVWDIPFRRNSKRVLHRYIKRMDRRIARILFKFADLFILSILPDIEFVEFGIPREKKLLLKNAIWLNDRNSGKQGDCALPSEPFRIMCMRSRFLQDHGLDILAQAFDLLNKTHDNIELTIVGSVPKVVRPQVELLGRRSNVFFREFVEHDELLRLTALSTVCVVPFRETPDLSQTFPIKILEYLSLGTVVIASNLPGIASMVKHRHNGLLFKPGDAVDLADKLRTVYEDRELAVELSSRAATLCDEYDCRRKAEVILSALKKLGD